MLQVQIQAAGRLVAASVVLDAIVAVKLHVPDRVLQLVLDRAPEVVPGLVIILVQELAVALVMGAQVVQEIAKAAVAVLETVDLVVPVVAVALVTDAVLLVQMPVEQAVVDSVEINACSVVGNGGLYA